MITGMENLLKIELKKTELKYYTEMSTFVILAIKISFFNILL